MSRLQKPLHGAQKVFMMNIRVAPLHISLCKLPCPICKHVRQIALDRLVRLILDSSSELCSPEHVYLAARQPAC